MKTTNFKKLILLSFLFVSLNVKINSQIIDPEKELFINNKWAYVEEKFITEPLEKYNSFFTNTKKVLSSLAISVTFATIAGYITNKLTKNNLQENNQQQVGSFINYLNNHTKGLTAISSISSGMFGATLGSYVYCKYKIKKIDLKTLNEFISEWDENKFVTPEEFKNSFDSLYKMKNNIKEIKAIKIVKGIRAQIYKKYPHKYENILKIDGSMTNWNFNFNIAEILKIFINLFGNLDKHNNEKLRITR